MIKNCYIHIPFCNNICSYCDFCKMYYDENLVNKYLNVLEKEIKSIYKGEILDTIYIGGGTPSSLNISQLEKLLNICKFLNKHKKAEYSFEINLDSITKEKLLLLKKNGINRLSIGIESLNRKNQNLMNRYQSKDEIISKISLIRELGFTNINLDLMYAFPTEEIKDLKEDLDFILSLKPDHISTYSLIIEEHTKLYINNVKNIDEDLDRKMYDYICEKLKENNYIHYEISNFSNDNKYSRHNTCYWKNNNYYGFGLGAASYINNQRITNTRSMTKYLNKEFVKEQELETLMDKIYYEVILNLRLKNGINKKEFQKKYNISLEEVYNYKELLNKKYLIEDSSNVYIPEDKWYIMNEILLKILEGEVNE